MARRDEFEDDDDEILEEIGGIGFADALPAAEPSRPEASRRAPPRIVLDDSALFVVDKPAWLSVRSDDEQPGLLEVLDVAPPAGLAAPMDDRASGLTVIGRSDEIVAALQQQIRDGRMAVTHLAIVRAVLPAIEGRIEQRLRVPRHPWQQVRVDAERGEPARTDWRLVEAFAGHAVIACVARTVIRHQIRAHLAAAGMPLAVDPSFGGGRELLLSSFKAGYRPSRRHREKPLLARLSLHVQRIELIHPRTGEPLILECDPPRDFRAAVQQLSKHGRLPPPRAQSRRA